MTLRRQGLVTWNKAYLSRTKAMEQPGSNWWVFWIAIVIFLAPNLGQIDFVRGAAAFILCWTILFCVHYVTRDSISAFPLPITVFCLSIMVFHLNWGRNHYSEWVQRGIEPWYVALALLVTAVAVLACTVGTELAKRIKLSHQDRSSSSRLCLFKEQVLIMSGILLALGWFSRLWALANHLIGFQVEAFGIVSFHHTGRFVMTILAIGQMVGIGQSVLLALLLQDLKTKRAFWTILRNSPLYLFMLSSYIADFVFRLQSGARGKIIWGFIPVLLLLHAYGYRKAVYGSIIAGIILYILVIYPLGDMIRYDTHFQNSLSTGKILVPSIDYFEEAYHVGRQSREDALSRLNQTSLLAYAIEARSEGLQGLGGLSYWYAFKTVVPRFAIPWRGDQQINYDIYTGYSSGLSGYNNWGIHTEAYLNFGIVGVILIMITLGFIWQKMHTWLLQFEYPVGWAILANTLLPSVLRAGEYGFLASIISMFKSLLFILLCVKVLVAATHLLEG